MLTLDGPSGLLLLLLAGLATARVTRLLVADTLTEPLRGFVWRRVDPRMRHIGYILSCPHCAGVWSAAGVVGLLSLAHWNWDTWYGRMAGVLVAIMAVAQAGAWLAGPSGSTGSTEQHGGSGTFLLAVPEDS